MRAVILGKGGANETKDGRKTMCAIAWSADVGLFRFYPLNIDSPAKVWLECDLDLEKDGSSYRQEDWKLRDSRRWDDQSDRIVPVKTWRRPDSKLELLRKLCEVYSSPEKDPIEVCNTEPYKSITVVKPKSLEGRLAQNPNFKNGRQGDLWDYHHWVRCQDDFRHVARLRWVSEVGKEHESKIVAQEFFEGVRKRPHMIWSYSQIYNHEYEKYLILGNSKRYPNAFMVVHVHRIKKAEYRTNS